MVSDEEEELNQAMYALGEFIKILVKEYPVVFKDGSGKITLSPSTQNPFFPYEVSLEVSKKK
jgi:hypothetical protein